MNVCAKFHLNPYINPYNGEKITIGSPIYQKLNTECNQMLPIVSNSQIINLFLGDLSKIKQINGPNSLTVMELNGKILFLFGDFHTRAAECKIKLPGDLDILNFFRIVQRKITSLC